MRARNALVLSLSLALGAHAFELPFQVPFFAHNKHGKAAPASAADTARRVAIIGAGAGGSSAAFWIGKAKERYGLDIEVDVYERADYIGGRSTAVHPYGNKTLKSVEVGGSIFIEANKNLWRAADEFNLTRTKFGDESGDVGIWDGEQFIFVMQEGGFLTRWWQTAKVLWRYGPLSPYRANVIADGMKSKFASLYLPAAARWKSVEDLSVHLGWKVLAARTASEHFVDAGVSRQFTHEMIEAATRVNYGQDADEIHALGAAVSLVAENASGVKGGNFQIFEHFLNASGARVALKTPVKSITRKAGDAHWTVETSRGVPVDYAAVLLAAPYHQTGIAITSPTLTEATLPAALPDVPYVHLHVTLLTTTSPHPRPSYFGLPDNTTTRMPTMMLTTWDGVRARNTAAPEFNSLSYHGLIRGANGSDTEGEPKEWVVKIFSKERVSDAWLADIFMGQVGWVHRKEWKAYPKLLPTTTFPSVKLDTGLYYVNSFEPFISTMETETLSARNAVDLLLHEYYASGVCGPWPTLDQPARDAAANGSFVLGWDC